MRALEKRLGTASAALQDLIAKWRETAKKIGGEGTALGFQWLQCADQLETALQGIAIPHQDQEL